MLSLMIPPSGVSRTGSAVVPCVLSSSHPGRGRVMSTTWKATLSLRLFKDSRISNRWEKGHTGMWYTVGVFRRLSPTVCRKVSLDKLPPFPRTAWRLAGTAGDGNGWEAGMLEPQQIDPNARGAGPEYGPAPQTRAMGRPRRTVVPLSYDCASQHSS